MEVSIQPPCSLSTATTRVLRPLRIGIATDGLEERTVNGEIRIANGGVGTYIYNLVKHLLQVDTDNQYYLIRCGVGRLDLYDHPKANRVFIKKTLVRAALRPLDLAHRRLARELKLDLIHYPNQFGGLSLQRSIRRVATLHDLTPLLLPEMHPKARVQYYRRLARPCLARCDRVIVYSSNTRRDLVERGFAQESCIVNIPLGVDSSFRRGATTDSFLARYQLEPRFMLSVGVLEPRKNHRLLLEVLERLHQQGERLCLVLVGREGWNWSNPLDEPKFGRLRPYVKIFKDVPQDDLVEFYNRATVFVYPSLYEGFGLPILEAMACGVPVVASDASSIPEVAGDAALLASPHDPDAFAAQVQRIIRDQQLRTRLIEAGLERSRTFSWRRTAEATLEVYRAVCDSSLSA